MFAEAVWRIAYQRPLARRSPARGIASCAHRRGIR